MSERAGNSAAALGRPGARAGKDKKEDMIKFLKNYGNPFDEIGVDELGSIAIEWGVYGVPETFLIDNSNKKIIKKFIGPINSNSIIEIRNLIK